MGEGEARRFWVYEKDGMDVCAELRCSTVQYHHRLWLPSLASVLLFSTLSQPASQPASSHARRFGRRREIARQCALARRRAVCVREQRTRTQTYLTDALLLQCCCAAAATLLRIMRPALHSRRPACSFVCSYADVPVATGRWRAWGLL